VRAGAVVRWALGTPAVLALTDELAAGLAWEALHGAVAKTLARTQARAPAALRRASWRVTVRVLPYLR
jgi:hypothetical protein